MFEEEPEPISISKFRREVPFVVRVPIRYARAFGLIGRVEIPILAPEEG